MEIPSVLFKKQDDKCQVLDFANSRQGVATLKMLKYYVEFIYFG